MAQRLFLPREQVFSDLGAIGAGYQLFFYESGTEDAKDTYSDIALTVPNPNPVTADSAGRIGNIYVNDTSEYKVILKDADDNLIWTVDPADPFQITYDILNPLPVAFAGTTTGTGIAYTITSDLGLTEYSGTQAYLIEFHAASQAGATLQFLDSPDLEALTLKKYDNSGSLVDIEDDDLIGTKLIWCNGESFVTLDSYKPYLSGINITPATTTSIGVSYLPSLITIANNVSDANNDIDYSAGVFTFSDGSGQALATAMTKRSDSTWAAGTNQGGLDTGVKTINTWYYNYAIYNPTTKVSDFIISANNTTPDLTLAVGYTKYKKLLGGFKTDSSNNIIAFIQSFNTFMFPTSELVYTGGATNSSTANIFPSGAMIEGKLAMEINTLSSGENTLYVRGNLQANEQIKICGASASGNATGSGQTGNGTGITYGNNGTIYFFNSGGPSVSEQIWALGFTDLSNPY